MSTKNLARTVIEGGRTGYATYARRTLSQEFRHETKRYCDAVRRGDVDPEAEPAPAEGCDWDLHSHADKINPVKRFLAARAGRPWNDVRSEVCRRFDRRKIAGMHVTNDHILREAEGYGFIVSWRSYGAWIDDQGVLQYSQRKRFG